MFARKHLAGILALIMTGCSGSSSTTEGQFKATTENQAIIDNYVDNVILATYELLDTRAANLEAAAITLQSTPTAGNLTAIQDAWRETRVPWEQSEAFLFGPVATNGFDPSMDSWPVNKTDLDAVLAGTDPLTEEYVSNLDPTLKGFHTIEYLIFGEAGTRVIGDFDTRMFEYLIATTAELKTVTGQLVGSWTSGATPYADTFKTAGQEGNATYPSLSNAAEELVRGLIAITDEVANGKIADPFDQGDPNLVESQFSYNSLVDFSNNIRGVKFVYLGDQETAGTTGTGLNVFVSAIDPALDTQIQSDIQAAIDAILEIAEPFSESITDPAQESKIRAAQDAIRLVKTTLENNVLPLIVGSTS